ncbi:MAG: DUF4197 domain-containing protein [Burkholderiaceae bacterium]|nr:DUF4197 domain-containing protein [Rhodoferax sp.]MCB2004051.1 DUF4197 domain-containing protein [Rhodoferax sp.]MCB2027682.1 DUF4197 domain-containing protein [Rhodoferax sp.]MCB2042495.1 DUF4197 domain-containing protein [Rhodoferax sp.]MCP5261103.1 DUF4197 domain-containing protein [Rhodoferax sp.]
MDRRHFNTATSAMLASVILLAHARAHALSLSDLTDSEASDGLKTALEKGALAAISLLGRKDGFLSNEAVRIPLPGYLEDASKLLKTFGQGKRVDELVTAMNRAAETAVPMAKDLLVGAVKSMSVTDAKNILTGGDTSVTAFFAGKTRDPLSVQFLPVVTRATEKVSLASKYNRVASKAAGIGLIGKDEAKIENYVTGKTLDGLYFVIGEEERKIRRDPVGTGSAILKKVFGVFK